MKTSQGRRRAIVEYGDFQTPPSLARRIGQLLQSLGIQPNSIVEPTCGKGSILLAASDTFPHAQRVCGVDINPTYISQLQDAISRRADQDRFHVECADIFAQSLEQLMSPLPEPWLVVGNPPWVTNAGLGKFDSDNLPTKSNAAKRRGIEALTGHSNFDVSEWILREIARLLDGRRATLAMLCKTSVARKLSAHLWSVDAQLRAAAIYPIDATAEFEAAVDACLFLCDFEPKMASRRADVYESLEAKFPRSSIGWHSSQLIADMDRFERGRHLYVEGKSPDYVWRSGIKHDCSQVFELRQVGSQLQNGLGEIVDIETDHLFPLLKSSDLAKQSNPRRWVIVSQRYVGDDTRRLAEQSPRTWQYLLQHEDRLQRRRSSIYKNQPPFSIFGVGDYSFSPWKVAISGLYKNLSFRVIGPEEERPVMLDDTCYFLPCENETQANSIASALSSHPARDFLSSLIFWDAKRPITASILRRLDLNQLLA